MRRSHLAALCLVTLIGVTGCDSDNDVFTRPQTAEQATQSATQQITVPAIEGLNLISFEELLFGGPPAGISGGECIDYSETCTTGGVEMCYEQQGMVVDFDQCQAEANGKTYDGTLTEGEGTATYALVIDGVTFSGTINLDFSEECLIESLTNFSVTSSSSSSVASGELEYCYGEDWPAGSSNFTVDEVWQIDMVLDGTNIAVATVMHLASPNNITICQVDLATGLVGCSIT